MNGEALADCPSRRTATCSFVRSALLLAGSVLVLTVVLSLIAASLGWTGANGPQGVVFAAAICLMAGLTAEAAGIWLSQFGPLVVMLMSMALRLAPPLIICMLLALMGESGREQLPFVSYLLAFYLVTLLVESIMAVKRASHSSSRRS